VRQRDGLVDGASETQIAAVFDHANRRWCARAPHQPLAAVIDGDDFEIAAGLALEAVETLAQSIAGSQRGNDYGDSGGAQVLILAPRRLEL